jgi:hypothetical protein
VIKSDSESLSSISWIAIGDASLSQKGKMGLGSGLPSALSDHIVWERRRGMSLDTVWVTYENEDCACLSTHLQTLEPSLYPHNILLQFALNSLA